MEDEYPYYNSETDTWHKDPVNKVKIKVGGQKGCVLEDFGKHNNLVDRECARRISEIVSESDNPYAKKLFDMSMDMVNMWDGLDHYNTQEQDNE
ncbi:MAG: hypothetical protein ACW96M_05355 [Candidatus Thorarchaeota archaeon]|jgi:hypothetical protein